MEPMEPSVKTFQILSFDRSRILGTVEAESVTLAARAWVERVHGQNWVFRTYDHDRRMVVWQAWDQKRKINPLNYWQEFFTPLGEPFQLSPEH